MSKEIIILMGFPCAGKSTLVKQYEADGYTRVNRDDEGGTLKQLNAKVEDMIVSGIKEFVLDNTYGTKEVRKDVIDLAKRHGLSVKCVWLKTSIEDSMFNSCYRILKKILQDKMTVEGIVFADETVTEVLGPDWAKIEKSSDVIPAIALFTYRKAFEEPTMDEGFSEIEVVVFKREIGAEYKNKALILDYDDTLRETKNGDKFPISPDNIVALPNRTKVLKQYLKDGYILLGVSNQSGVGKGTFSKEDAEACFDKTNELLGIDIEYQYCPHNSFPLRCYCRKPQPGLGVYFIEKYKLNPSECIFVGDQTSDKTFAKRCGFKFEKADKFFGV